MTKGWILLFLVWFPSVAGAATPVETHGRLRVEGNKIVGEDKKTASLAGCSFFWSQWMGQYWNADCVRWLQQDWRIGIVRAAMGIEPDGYLANPEQEKARVIKVVDAAIASGMYVIIDWHDHHAERHAKESIAFFQEMARKYGRQPHVIYEIYNEPLVVSWKDVVKPYAEQVVAAIRAIDPDNLIVVGTPRWSQDVDVAAADPIVAANIAYTLHFYAGTHKQPLRDKALAALSKGAALFVTEWGTCNADGDGPVDEISTSAWLGFMRTWDLSHCNWAVSDKRETASILKPGAAAKGGWSDDQLTPSGLLVRRWTREWAGNPSASGSRTVYP
jgi:endoglucanase